MMLLCMFCDLQLLCTSIHTSFLYLRVTRYSFSRHSCHVLKYYFVSANLHLQEYLQKGFVKYDFKCVSLNITSEGNLYKYHQNC